MKKEENIKNYTNTELIKDIWFYIRPYRGKFFFATISRIIADLAWLYPVYALALIVEFLTKYHLGDNFTLLYIIFGIWILAAIVRHLGQHFATMICYKIANRSGLDSSIHLMKHLFLLDMDWHEKENSGNKMKKIDKGGAGIEKILRMWITNYIEISINFVGMVFIVSRFNFGISIAMSCFIVSYYLFSKIYRKKAITAQRIASAQDEHVNGILFESINNIRTVKAMSMSKKIISVLNEEINDLFKKVSRRIFLFQTGGRFLSFYGATFQIFLFIFIAFEIIHGRYEVSFLVLCNGYFTKIWQTVNEFTDVSDQLASAKSDISRMQDLLKVPINIDIEEGKVLMPKDWKKIIIQNLSFSYEKKKVLNNIDFEINRGEKVGIVGLSGAGKSTLFKLFLKENESYTGKILFDDVLLKKISKKNYLKHTAVVLQETELFNTSLYENIAISSSREEGANPNNEVILKKAIEVAHVKDFMDKLPDGVESIVGEKGVKLSGGEKQRVGIARAVYKEPELLLMDEATSHLDIESEKKIQDSLHEFFKGVTAVVIAHRLTTIKEMDKIIVLEEGKIIEEGSFRELQEKRGRFFELWEKQKL